MRLQIRYRSVSEVQPQVLRGDRRSPPKSWWELAELIQELIDTDSEIVHTDSLDSDIDHSVADISKADEQLDFTPSVSLREGFERWQSDVPTTKQTQSDN